MQNNNFRSIVNVFFLLEGEGEGGNIVSEFPICQQRGPTLHVSRIYRFGTGFPFMNENQIVTS